MKKKKKELVTPKALSHKGEGFFLAKLPKDLLGIQDLNRTQIENILEKAKSYASEQKTSLQKNEDLKGRTVINLFFEPSTRTRTSFELAARRLSADLMTITPQGSSLAKGESLKDMVENLEAMGPDLLIVRHASSGTPGLIASHTEAAVVNAGDGSHEHPTQALVDLFTVREKLGRIDGLHLVIVGDISYSRVARSNLYGFKKLGAKVTFVGPATLIPPGVEKLGAHVETNLDRVLPEADVIMFLRIQKERQEKMNFPSLSEYTRFYGLTKERWARLGKKTLIMHPGPINRGVEIDPDIADGKLPGGAQTVILDQVTNGKVVRMAVLSLWGQRRRSL